MLGVAVAGQDPAQRGGQGGPVGAVPSWLRPSASSVGVWPVVAAAVTAAMTGSHSVRRGGRVLRGLVGQGCRGGQQVGQGLIGGVGVGAQGGDEVTEADAVAGVD